MLERLGKDLKKTARSLREREERIFTQERSSAPRLKAKPEDWANFYGRDYTFLCRGLELVTKKKMLCPTTVSDFEFDECVSEEEIEGETAQDLLLHQQGRSVLEDTAAKGQDTLKQSQT